MKKNKFSEESKEVLSLGNLHEEIQQEKKIKKAFIFPIIFLFIGLLLILTGVFYNDIKKLINLDHKPKEETKKEKTGVTVLTCNYQNEDKTLGLNKEKTIVYKFKDNLLKETTDILTISIIENNYDIGSNNIKVYKQKYDEVLNPISLDGLSIDIKLDKEVLTKKVIYNFEILDVSKIPSTSYLSITNKKDQSYREIKEIEGRAGHICKVTNE